MNIFSENLLWSIGIIFALFILWIKIRFNINQNRINTFNKAAEQFRAAFPQVLHDLSTEQKWKRTLDIIEENIIEQERAMQLFQPYIDKSDVIGFDKAWQEYGSNKNQRSSDYGFMGNTIREATVKKLALDRIHNLLLFANNK